MVYLLAKLGFSMLACAFAASFLRADLVFVLGTAALLAGVCFCFFPKRSREFFAIFIAAALAFGLTGIRLVDDFYPSAALDGMTADISGTVTAVSAGGGNPVYTVETDYIGIEGAPQNITLRLSGWDENYAEAYDVISCTVTFRSYSESDISDFLANRSGGISVYAYTKTPISVTGRGEASFGYFIHLMRDKISSVIHKYFIGWHAPFMEQLLIGTRGELEDSVSASFRRAGMSHILAISGMHMVILSGLFEKFLGYRRSIGTPRKIKILLLIFAVGLYMFIGGLGMSVLRSGFMLIVHYAARLFFSGSKSLDSLGIAIGTVLFIDPLAACDAGFLMSVCSSAAIVIFAPPLKSFLENHLHFKGKAAEFFTEAFSVSFVAFLAVLPVSAIAFGEVSLVSPVSNLFAGFLSQYSIIFGTLTVVLGFLPVLNFLAGGTAFITMIFSGALLKVAEFFSGLPFASTATENAWVYVWLIGAAALIILPALYSKSLRYIPHSLLMCAFVLLSGILSDFIFYSGTAEVKITALEHGTAVSCSVDGSSVLITHGLDAHDEYELGESYDVFISLGAESGSAELEAARSFEPSFAILSYSDAAERYEGAEVFSAGCVNLWEGTYIEFLSEGVFAAEFGEATVLYISEECDIMDIAPKFRRVDIIILDGVSPEDFPQIRCEYLIFRRMSGYFSGSAEIITLDEGEIQFFAYNENVTKGWACG